MRAHYQKNAFVNVTYLSMVVLALTRFRFVSKDYCYHRFVVLLFPLFILMLIHASVSICHLMAFSHYKTSNLEPQANSCSVQERTIKIVNSWRNFRNKSPTVRNAYMLQIKLCSSTARVFLWSRIGIRKMNSLLYMKLRFKGYEYHWIEIELNLLSDFLVHSQTFNPWHLLQLHPFGFKVPKNRSTVFFLSTRVVIFTIFIHSKYKSQDRFG